MRENELSHFDENARPDPALEALLDEALAADPVAGLEDRIFARTARIVTSSRSGVLARIGPVLIARRVAFTAVAAGIVGVAVFLGLMNLDAHRFASMQRELDTLADSAAPLGQVFDSAAFGQGFELEMVMDDRFVAADTIDTAGMGREIDDFVGLLDEGLLGLEKELMQDGGGLGAGPFDSAM